MYSFLKFRAASPVAAALIAAATLAACNDSTAPNRRSLSLSISSRPAAALASGRLAANGAPMSAAAIVSVITLSKVQIVLSHIELSRKDSGLCNVTGDADCNEFEGPPMLVSVPMAGVTTMVTVPVAEGTYKKLEAEMGKLDTSSATGRAFVAANPTFAQKNVRVEGTYNGAPFTYTALVEGELEMRFNPPLVVTSATKNLSVAIDISRWFINPATGASLDPSDPANAEIIARNIRASFNAHEDNNKDG